MNSMIEISPEYAREMFVTCGCGHISQHESGVFADLPERAVYLIGGCLAVGGGDDGRWQIHALGPWSDIGAAYDAVKPMSNGEVKLFPRYPLPSGWKDMKGEFRLARTYGPYDDADIRGLTPGDMPQIERMCAYDEEDDRFGHKLTSEFIAGCRGNPDHFFSTGYAFGLFDDGELSGFITGGHMGYIGTTVINLFVSRKKRGRGFASRLVKALCASDPGTVYGYSCEKDNQGSYRTALKCGFIPVGESLEG